jgi:hypothetical protein
MKKSEDVLRELADDHRACREDGCDFTELGYDRASIISAIDDVLAMLEKTAIKAWTLPELQMMIAELEIKEAKEKLKQAELALEELKKGRS